MKKILLPEAGNEMHYYRANLHCHSTVSDGRKTPEELKAFYQAKDYSVIAYTDHEAFLSHNDLTDDSFLALNGYELGVNSPYNAKYGFEQTCHMCFVALEPDNNVTVCGNGGSYLFGNALQYIDRLKFEENEQDDARVYSAEYISDMMRRGREHGFFVTYNHPTWSLEFFPEYTAYENMNAMEIVNNGCVTEGYDDDNGHCYEDMLRAGKRLFCIATDDNHNIHDDNGPKCDSFGGYTMIAAPKLEYRTITKALEAGQFYASSGNTTHTGPEIKSLVYEDGVVTIKTSPARMINFMPNRRACQNVIAKEGEFITEASFRMSEGERWFRLTVIDSAGYKAYTNAYFPDTF